MRDILKEGNNLSNFPSGPGDVLRVQGEKFEAVQVAEDLYKKLDKMGDYHHLEIVSNLIGSMRKEYDIGRSDEW